MQPQFATIATANEMVVTTSFSLEIGETTGTIHFCLPYATLEPIRDTLYSPVQGETQTPDRRWVKLMTEQIQSAEVELVAELARAETTVEQLLALKPGDFIELDLKKAIQGKVVGRTGLRLPLRNLERQVRAQGRSTAVRLGPELVGEHRCLLIAPHPPGPTKWPPSGPTPSPMRNRNRRPTSPARPTRSRRPRSPTSRRPWGRAPATTST